MTAFQGIEVFRGKVLADWIDVNQHMNVAYYVLAFDLGVDALWTRFGITEDSIRETGASTFAVECHVTYQAELGLGDEFVVTSEILAIDTKRIHQFQRMFRAADGVLVATCEWMNLCVDLAVRKVSEWPAAVFHTMQELATSQNPGGVPPETGRRMRVEKPVFTIDPAY